MQPDQLKEVIKEVILDTLGVPIENEDEPFSTYMDSLSALEAIMDLEEKFDILIPVNRQTLQLTLSSLSTIISDQLAIQKV